MARPRKNKKESHGRRDEDSSLTHQSRKGGPHGSKIEPTKPLAVKKAYVVPKQTKKFDDLPYEVCVNIYFQLFRPDACSYELATGWWKNALGCTKVLTLNKKIYAEALPILHDVAPPELKFHGRARNIFRHPLATGIPNLFCSFSREIFCYIPPSLTELSVVRLKKLTVSVRYPTKSSSSWGDDTTTFFVDGGQEQLGVLQKNFAQLHTAISKSKDLVQLHFKIQTARYDRGLWNGIEYEGTNPITDDDIQEMMDVFRPFLITASQDRFRITAEEDMVLESRAF